MSTRPFRPAPKPSQKKQSAAKRATVVVQDLPAIGSTVHHVINGSGTVEEHTERGKVRVTWASGQSTWIEGRSRHLVPGPAAEEHDDACAAEHTTESAPASCLDAATAETIEAPQNAETADQEPEMTATTTTAKAAPVVDDLGYDRAAIAIAEAAAPIGSEVKHRKNGAGRVGGYSKGGKLQIRWFLTNSISYVEHTSKTLTSIVRPEELATVEDQAGEELPVIDTAELVELDVIPVVEPVAEEAAAAEESTGLETPAAAEAAEDDVPATKRARAPKSSKAARAAKAEAEAGTPAMHLSGTIGELVTATPIAGSPKTVKEQRRRHSTHVAPLVDHRPASELSAELVAEAVNALISKGVKAITATSQVGLLVRAAKRAGVSVDGWRKLVTDAA